MAKDSYDVFDFLSDIDADSKKSNVEGSGKRRYNDILNKVRNEILENHAEELSSILTDADSADTLRLLISKALYLDNIIPGINIDDNIVEQIYQDMAGLGILTQYIQDPAVEEININSYNNVEVVYSNGTKYLSGGFATPTAAVDIVKKMSRMGGKILDATTPQVDSYIGGGTRISAMIPPIVPTEAGVSAEIRKQNKSSITEEQILASEAATKDEIDLLSMCLNHSVSIGIAGSTGSGKTTDQGFFINRYIEENSDWNDRIFVIEDTAELVLVPWNKKKNRFSRIIRTVTRDGNNSVTMRDLIKTALRFHPHLIVPVEVRGAEALEAANAGRTGHTILTSLHAPDAITAYHRLLVMCTMANAELKEETLLKHCVEAWPIMVYKEQLRDGSRKYMQIFEATGVVDGKVQGNMLFQYTVDGEQRDDNGNLVKVLGHHEKVGCISPELFHYLCQKGADKQEILRLFPEIKDNKAYKMAD